MKRAILVLTIFVLLLAVTNAGVSGGLSAKGIKGGLNMANLTGDDMDEAESKMVYAAGIFAVLDINENLGLRPEVLYSLKGAKMEATEGGVDYKSSINMTYIDIPVLLQYSIPMDGSLKPCLFAGPSIGILMGAKWKIEAGGEEMEEDIKDDIKSTDLGLVVGAGLSLTDKISVDVRYSTSLSDISDDSGNEGESGSVKNTVISVLLGISL